MALSKIHKVPLGGGAYLLYGAISHAAGAADETLSYGGKAVFINVATNDANGLFKTVNAGWDEGESGGITTATLGALPDITSGRICALIVQGT